MQALQPVNTSYTGIGSQILSCYADEMQLSAIIVGRTHVDGVAVLASQFRAVALSLEKDAFCQTLFQS